ncbi:hypothetical protein BJV82DRAFT_666639 [Fennellomyces sp. T-0311]|nr:hypothetical protein BJV82DRAFT_666639 [Fennellomyces sp. T-0311]
MSGSMYHPPRQQYHPMAAHHPTVPSQSAARHPVYQQPPPPPPPEPLPSATDVQQTLALTIPQMAEFASSMVYLMWHARRPSVMALHSASKSADVGNPAEQDALQSRETASIASGTSSAFKKFSRQILHATQLSESVVMLSLKYIAMLLQKNPNIQGADGSEYRLFTVALMLANKFLDDNTFTNKTWSDVSGMKVTDLNIMELEFLDVLNFGLFVGKDEFGRWKVALVNFKNQLQSVYQAQEQQQRQKMIEASLKSVGLSMLQPQDQQQPTPPPQQPAQQQQPWTLPQDVTRQQSQQQQAAAVQQQYHQQYLFLLSKAQQPQFPTQPLNQPLVRVPLRIPAQPVYMNAGHSSTQQPAPQTAAPPPSQPSVPYEDTMMNMRTSAPVIVTSSNHESTKRQYPQQQSIAPSPIDTQYSSSHYPPRQTPAMHPVATSKPLNSRPMYDNYGMATAPPPPASANESLYPQYPLQRATTPTSGYPQSTYPPQPQPTQQPSSSQPPQQQQQQQQQVPLRQQPTPVQQQDYPTGGNVAPSSMYYYATPSTTPTSVHTDNYGYSSNGGSRPAVRSYYLESPAPAQQQMATPSTSAAEYHGNYGMSGSASQPVIGGDIYASNQQRMMRTASNPAYQNPPAVYPPQQPSIAQQPQAGYNKQYQPRQKAQQQPLSQPPPTVQTPVDDYSSGPVPEDPLTAAESYRTSQHRR